ncbi:hypothetical protein QE152_g29965 [Popillia japonica]|uniref:PHD-type domain-containing protein n=1 Tax=Popillia japonica TaxID=7064 RepID=A0AAW1JFL5_POPJA
MSSTCKKCTCSINKKSPGLFCAGDCRAFYHARCVQLPASALPSLTAPGTYWKCPDCRDVEDSSFVVDDGSDVMDEGVGAMFKTIRRELASLNKKTANCFAVIIRCTEEIGNYSVYRRDRATSASKKLDGGGVLLAVRNNFAVGHMFDLQSVAEDVWLSVECVGGRVLICGVYLPPGDELAQQAFLSNLQAVILDHPDEKISWHSRRFSQICRR